MTFVYEPAKVTGQAGEGHVVEAQDGERAQLAEPSRQPRNRIAAEVCDLERSQLLDVLRDIGNVCKQIKWFSVDHMRSDGKKVK